MKTMAATAVLLCSQAVWANEAPVGEQHEPVILNLASTAARLPVKAYWARIADGRYNLHHRYQDVFEYNPAEPLREYTAADFRAFLPREGVAVGDVWQVETTPLDSILQQFHPGATTQLRRGKGKPGAFACLRAISARYAEIAFRFHGEVELQREKAYLTPAQFTGHLLIDREQERVISLLLEVPDRNTNADVNAFGFADIVYIPKMMLRGGDTELRDAIEWRAEISSAQASKRLALSFYEFAKIAWTDLETAIGQAQREDKPLHAVVLFGSLDDESC